MRKLILISIVPFLAAMLLLGVDSIGAQEKTTAAISDPPYSKTLALKTLVNPHEQVNDEGEILWGVCLVCHKGVPDLNVEKSDEEIEHRQNLQLIGYESSKASLAPFACELHLQIPAAAAEKADDLHADLVDAFDDSLDLAHQEAVDHQRRHGNDQPESGGVQGLADASGQEG